MKSIFSYQSCQDFLRDAYKDAKVSQASFTIERYASAIGLGGSTLKMILSGKRRLTVSHVHRIAKALKLSRAELGYLEALSLKEGARQGFEKKAHSKKMSRVKKWNKVETVRISERGLLSEPFILPLLIYLQDIRRSFDGELTKSELLVLEENFGISRDRILASFNRIKKSVARPLTASKLESHFVIDQVAHQLDQETYVRKWLMEASERVGRNYRSSKDLFNFSTISIAEEDLSSIRADMKEVLNKYLERSSKKNMVIQVGIQIMEVYKDSGKNSL